MTEAPETNAQVFDLMEALRASLEKKPAKAVTPVKTGAQSPAKAAKAEAAPARKPPKRVEPAVPAATRKRAKG